MLYRITQVGRDKGGQKLYPPHGHSPVRGDPGLRRSIFLELNSWKCEKLDPALPTQVVLARSSEVNLRFIA